MSSGASPTVVALGREATHRAKSRPLACVTVVVVNFETCAAAVSGEKPRWFTPSLLPEQHRGFRGHHNVRVSSQTLSLVLEETGSIERRAPIGRPDGLWRDSGW
jgi:hypothetical protein